MNSILYTFRSLDNCSREYISKSQKFLIGFRGIFSVAFFLLFIVNTVSAQDLPDAKSCTSKDLLLVGATLPPPNNDPCACGGTRTLNLAINNKTGSIRPSFGFWGTLVRTAEDGTVTREPIYACTGPIPANMITTMPTSTEITYTCGESLNIEDLFLAWTSASDPTKGQDRTSCDYLEANPSKIAPKCGTLPSIEIFADVNALVIASAATCASDGSSSGSIDVTPFGGLAPYTVQIGTDQRTNVTSKVTFSNLPAGVEHSILVTDNRGCSKSVKKTIASPPTILIDAGEDFIKSCIDEPTGKTIGETAESGYTYSWSPATGLSATNVSNPKANPDITTTYTVTKTHTASGCKNTDEVTVTVIKPTVIAVAGLDFTKSCLQKTNGAQIGETSETGYSYIWLPAVGLSSANISNPTANPDITTTYTVTKTHIASGCEDTDDIVVTVNKPTVVAEAGSGFTKSCESLPNGYPIGENSEVGYTYSWSPATGLSDSTVSNPTANPDITTTYTVTKTHTSSGCLNTDTVEIIVNKPTVIAEAGSVFTKSCVLLATGKQIGETSEVGYSYSWSPSTGLSASNISNPLANPSETTEYTVTKTHTTSGCKNTDTVLVTVDNTPPDAPTVCVVQPSLCGPSTGSITINSPLGSGYEYSIDDGTTWQASPDFLNLGAGSVTGIRVKITASGCISGPANCDVSECTPPLPSISSSLQSNVMLAPEPTSVKVFPNPFRNAVKFLVNVQAPGKGTLELVDLNGRLIHSVHDGQMKEGINTFEIDLPKQKTGMLFYILRTGDQKLTGKLIKM